jgi:DNA-directed RNA polymerase subunit RPC12/RpoP
MDIISATGMMTSALKNLFDLTQALKNESIDQAVMDKTISQNIMLLELQSFLVKFNKENSELLKNNQHLKKQIEVMNIFQEEIKKYQFLPVPDVNDLNFYQYQKQDETDKTPAHYLCPKCVSQQVISGLLVNISQYECPCCAFKISVQGRRNGSSVTFSQ